MVQEVYKAFKEVTSCTKAQLRGKIRTAGVSKRRNMLCALLKAKGMTPMQIAFEIDRNRTTVERAIRTHNGEMEFDGRYAEEYQQILQMCKDSERA